jgi:hypothetical protein
VQGKELEQNINVEAISPGVVYDYSKPAAPDTASIPLTEFSDYGSNSDYEGDNSKNVEDTANAYSNEAANAATSNGSPARPPRAPRGAGGGYAQVVVGDDEESGDGEMVDQSAAFWQRLGISGERRNSRAGVLDTDDLYNEEDDHLETAEDAPDLEFHDRLYRRNSLSQQDDALPPGGIGGSSGGGGGHSTAYNMRHGNWSGLRMPKR